MAGCSTGDTPVAPPLANRQAVPQKVIQLLGDEDRATAPALPVASETLTRFGIAGADLGYPVVLGSKTFFLFADIVGTTSSVTDAFADAVGWSADVSATSLTVDFYPADADATFGFLPLRVGGLLLGQNDGPSSAFTDGSDLFVLFDVGHDPQAIDPVTATAAGGERGFVGVSHDEGRSFEPLTDLPPPLVWTQTAVISTGTLPGLPWAAADSVLVWGRDQGAPVLAAAPLTGEQSSGWSSQWVWRSADAWSSSSSAATAIHDADGCFGNFSVSFVTGLNLWLLLERCPSAADNATSVIHYRTATFPLGPWSSSAVWFDAVSDGALCGYLHKACEADGGACCDGDITGFGFDDTVGGRPYGPYVMPALGTWDAASSTATVFGLMSTFNPYSPVLMRTELRAN